MLALISEHSLRKQKPTGGPDAKGPVHVGVVTQLNC
jgi:hypothetical protein